MKPREQRECSGGSKERGPVLAKIRSSGEKLGEVSCSKRACCCKGLVQLVSEELLEKEMDTESHSKDSSDCRGSERSHNKRVSEDAKENGIRKRLIDEEYWKQLAGIREEFNRLKLRIEES